MKSFYVLELQIDPGGARKWVQFVYPTLWQIQRELELDLWMDMTLFDGTFLLDCEERITLFAYLAGGEREVVDLRPFTALQGANGESFQVDTPVLDKRHGGEDRVWTLAGGKVLDWEVFGSAQAYVDWSAVPVTSLRAPLIEEGEFVEDPEGFRTAGSGDDRTGFRYGSYELEAGMDDAEYRASVAEYLVVDPDWLQVNAGAIRALVEAMHSTGRYDAMPILADALQEAGCENDLFLSHCRAPACAHARGSWLVELLRRTGAEVK